MNKIFLIDIKSFLEHMMKDKSVNHKAKYRIDIRYKIRVFNIEP